jgi:hypothetical protein
MREERSRIAAEMLTTGKSIYPQQAEGAFILHRSKTEGVFWPLVLTLAAFVNCLRQPLAGLMHSTRSSVLTWRIGGENKPEF